MVSRVVMDASPADDTTKLSLNFLLNAPQPPPPLLPDDASSSTRDRLDDLLTAAHFLEQGPRVPSSPPRAAFTHTSPPHFSPVAGSLAYSSHPFSPSTPATLPALSPLSVPMVPAASTLTPLRLTVCALPRLGVASEQSSCSSLYSTGRTSKRRKKVASVPCDLCGRLFGEQAAVRKHKRVVHLKVKDFACEVCNRRFAEKSNLKKHVQARHQHTRAHKCNECGKVFNFTDGLRRHINNCHLGLRPYACDLCPSSFKQRTHLQKHRQSVHGVKHQPKRSRREAPPAQYTGPMS